MMNHKVTDDERIIGRMATLLAGSISASNSVCKDGCIFATLCTLKEMMPREFEEALVIFLKHGILKEEK